jgi:hypothetical protein
VCGGVLWGGAGRSEVGRGEERGKFAHHTLWCVDTSHQTPDKQNREHHRDSHQTETKTQTEPQTSNL